MAKDVNAALRALEKLLELFRFERMVYMLATVGALIILLGAAVWLFFSDESGSTALALGMFASSGLITFTTSRLLTMWNQAFSLIADALQAEYPDDE